MTTATIVTPIIHMNGDRKQTLMDNIENAYMAVREAMKKLRECAPNGRNYYLVPGRMQLAEAQHRERQENLNAVYKSLEAEAIAIQDEYPSD